MFEGESESDALFRAEVRDWLEANLAEDLRNSPVKLTPAEIKPWFDQLLAQGWHAAHWPRQAGGMGASLPEQIILAEEFARNPRHPRAQSGWPGAHRIWHRSAEGKILSTDPEQRGDLVPGLFGAQCRLRPGVLENQRCPEW